MKSRKKNFKRISLTIGVILAVALLSVIVIPNFAKANNNGGTQNQGQVRTVTVSAQNIEKDISNTGQIVTGDEETLVLDKSKDVDTVTAKEGQAVKSGDVLLTYTDGTEITAPFNGVIKTVIVPDSTSGATGVNAGNGSYGITIMSTDTLITKLSVDETDLSSMKIGQAASITINALPNTPYTGKVTDISQTGTYSNGSSTFDVTITLDKTDNVKIGMSADVKIVTASVENAVAVPIEAVLGSGGNARVMVVGSDSKASPVQVQLGLANDTYVQILSGLSVGDTIEYAVPSSNSSAGTGGMGGIGKALFGNGKAGAGYMTNGNGGGRYQRIITGN